MTAQQIVPVQSEFLLHQEPEDGNPQSGMRHPAGLPRPPDGEPYIVKIKPSFISLNLHNIT